MHFAHSATPLRGAGARQLRAYNGSGAAGTWSPPPPPPTTTVNGKPQAPGSKRMPKATPYQRQQGQTYVPPMRTSAAPQYVNSQGYQLHSASNVVPVGVRHASTPTPAQVVRSQRPRKPATYTRNPLRPKVACPGCGFQHAPTPNCG